MKTALQKFRLTPEEKAALKKSAKAAKITVSELLRVAAFSHHHAGSKPAKLQAALSK